MLLRRPLFYFFVTTATILFSISTIGECRNYAHSRSELALTNQVVINQRDCGRGEIPIFVHTAAQTEGKYFERRMMIRRTWAREATKYRMRVLFVIGVPKNLAIERNIKRESDKYRDILQFNFVENYYNLTLKAISLLKWSYRHCQQAGYMVKVDDDTIINMPMLHHLVKNNRIPAGLTGLVMTTPANRRPGHKWYMPYHLYKKDSYDFVAGFSYMLPMSQLKPFLKTILTYPGPILDIDDLFLTGIVADHGGIRRNNSYRFKFFCGTDVCTMEHALVMHACADARNSETMYRIWKAADRRQCYPRLNRNQSRGKRSVEEKEEQTYLSSTIEAQWDEDISKMMGFTIRK